jgi:hypothetical protein
VAAAKGGEVIPSVQWKHKATGATASLFGAVPWSGSPGDTKEDWEKVTVGWTIRHPDGTIGIGKPPFHSKGEAEKWVEEHPTFKGMNVYASREAWKTAADRSFNVEVKFKGSQTWHFFDFGDTKAEADKIAEQTAKGRPHLEVRVVPEEDGKKAK